MPSTRGRPARRWTCLSALVDKSLVTKEDVRGVACYRLHETMREYARLKLRDAAEEEFSTRATSSTTGHGVSKLRTTRGIERWNGCNGSSWRSTTFDRPCGNASRPPTGDGDSTSPPRSATTGSPAAPPRACAGSTNCSPVPPDRPDVPARTYHFRGWLSMLQADPEAARPWLAQAIAAARAAEQLLAVVGIAVDGRRRRRTWPAIARLPDGSSTRPRLSPRSLPTTPRSIGLIQARAIHAFFEGDLDTARAASSDGVRLSRDAGDLYYLGPDAVSTWVRSRC